jgi:hypothetical protein
VQLTQAQILRQKRLKAELWRKGELSWLLDDTQVDMVAKFRTSDARKFVLLCSRRLGKTHTMCVLALMQAMSKPKSKILFITYSFKAARDIVQPIFSKLLEDCPQELRPVYRVQEGKYVLKNGSVIALHGADKSPDGIRGQEAELVIIDEAAFVSNLSYMLQSVILPMLMLVNGRCLMATTPPKTLDHDFVDVLGEAEANNAVVKKTVYDCPRITPKMIEEYKREAGGSLSIDWRREYELALIPDSDNLVLPEFSEEMAEKLAVEVPRTAWADCYVGMDLGFTDDTALVFAWWDFENARLVVEDELIIKKENTRDIAAKIKAKEADLWGNKAPYKRVADHNNPQLIYDLNSLHGLSFGKANKDAGKEPMINKVRLAIASEQILVHPRCRNLIAQMKYARWKDEGKTTFDRSANFGHFDLVDALILLWNSINRGHMPNPPKYDMHNQYVANVKHPASPLQALVGKLVARPTKPNKIIRRRFK